MKIGTALRVLMLIGVAAVVTAALSLAVTATASVPRSDRAPDTTTVGRLSGGSAADDGERVQATTAISDAAWLAGGLLSAIEFEVNLPLLER